MALSLGFALHAFQRGALDALAGGETAGHIFPLLSILFYVSAIATGGWFIFPKALPAAKRLRPDMNLLMTVAVIGAVGVGEWFEAGAVAFLFALATLWMAIAADMGASLLVIANGSRLLSAARST